MIAKTEYLSRILHIQNRCIENKLDAFLTTSEDNLYYLTGKSCMPFERPFILIIWADKSPTFFLPRLELEHMSVIGHIESYVSYYEYPSPVGDSWQTVLHKTLQGCRNIATDLYTRSEVFSFLKQSWKVEALDWMYTLRYRKSPSEIALMKAAADYTREAMGFFIKKIRYGDMALESLEPAKRAQKKALTDRKFDVDYFALKFQSAAWPAPKSAEPHSIPNVLMPYRDGPHVFILSNRLEGYAIELERTFFTSRPTDEMKEYFSHMLKAREIAFTLCRPGQSASRIDETVREYLFSQGFEKNVIHRTGHGMGVSNHEGPFLAAGSDTILEPGMTVTVEPGLYFQGLGAFRHSDTILITEEGYENLTEFPTDIESLTVLKKRGLKSRIKQAIVLRMMKG